MKAVEDYSQETVDRLCMALGWAIANEKTFTRLGQMGVDESGLGDRAGRPGKRFKIMGILRDTLRQKSVGIIEEIPEKGLVKYAKPAGVIAALVPTTNPALTPPGVGIYALKCKDAVISSPHPRSRNTTLETVKIMRAALRRQAVPEDLFQCVEKPSIPMAQELMSICDLTIATGGTAMAAIRLLERAGAEVIACSFVVDLPDLGGRAKLEGLGKGLAEDYEACLGACAGVVFLCVVLEADGRQRLFPVAGRTL